MIRNKRDTARRKRRWAHRPEEAPNRCVITEADDDENDDEHRHQTHTYSF